MRLCHLPGSPCGRPGATAESNPIALIPIPAVDTVPRDSNPRESPI